MAYILGFLLECATIFRKYFRKQSVPVLLTIGFLVFFTLVGGLNSANPDYKVYESLFFDRFPGNYSVTEPLYVCINKLVHSAGISFQMFFLLQVLVSVLLMNSSIAYFTKNTDIVWAYYLLFPFAVNIVQIRYMLASSIVIFSLIYLHKYHKSHNICLLVLYVGLVLLAGMIHFSTLLFIICAVLELLFKKQYNGLVVGVLGAAVIANFRNFSGLISGLIGDRKAANWLYGNESYSIGHIGLVLIMRMMICLTVFLLIYFASSADLNALKKDYLKNIMSFLKEDEKSKWLCNMILFMVITFIPLELFMQQFVRLTRVYLVLLFILYARTYNKKRTDNMIAVSLTMDMSFLIIFLYEYSRGINDGSALFNTVFRQIFEG